MRARTEEAKDGRRRALIDAALDEFYQNGFVAARTDDIANRAGVTKGTLYLYFESKDDLFAGIIDTIAVPQVERFESAAEASGSASESISMIMRLVPIMIQDSKIPLIFKVLIGDGTRFPEVTETYRQRVVNRIIALWTSIVARGQADNEFMDGDPSLIARLVVAPIVFSVVWRILFESEGHSSVDLEALFALHERMVLKALSPE